MASSAAQSVRQERLAQWRAGVKRGAQRSWEMARGGLLIAAAAAGALALASYRPSDPSLNTAAAGPVSNWLGTPGAWVSDLFLTLWGLGAALILPLVFLLGLRVAAGGQVEDLQLVAARIEPGERALQRLQRPVRDG